MRIHTLIHAPFEKLGAIENWANEKNHSLTSTHTYQGETLPSTSAFDFLIIMGGPQSPTQLRKYPYLRDEISLAKRAIENNQPVLGICLGAQIIGESLGAKTERSPEKEIGVYPVELTNEAHQDPLFKLLPNSFDVMHWHNDMPGLAKDSILLAKSAGCPRQAVRYAERVYGLQFHLEMTSSVIKEMLAHCAHDLAPGKYIQEKEKILAANMSEINRKLFLILDYLAAFTK